MNFIIKRRFPIHEADMVTLHPLTFVDKCACPWSFYEWAPQTQRKVYNCSRVPAHLFIHAKFGNAWILSPWGSGDPLGDREFRIGFPCREVVSWRYTYTKIDMENYGYPRPDHLRYPFMLTQDSLDCVPGTKPRWRSSGYTDGMERHDTIPLQQWLRSVVADEVHFLIYDFVTLTLSFSSFLLLIHFHGWLTDDDDLCVS